MSLTLLHELNANQQHRIVVIADDGTNEASTWFHVSEIAHLRDLFACASTEHNLPVGIFTVKEKPHQVLA